MADHIYGFRVRLELEGDEHTYREIDLVGPQTRDAAVRQARKAVRDHEPRARITRIISVTEIVEGTPDAPGVILEIEDTTEENDQF